MDLGRSQAVEVAQKDLSFVCSERHGEELVAMPDYEARLTQAFNAGPATNSSDAGAGRDKEDIDVLCAAPGVRKYVETQASAGQRWPTKTWDGDEDFVHRNHSSGAEVRVLLVLRKSAAVKHDIVPVDVSTHIDIAIFEVARIEIRQSNRIGPLFLGGQSHSAYSGTALAFGKVKLKRKLVRGANGAPFHRERRPHATQTDNKFIGGVFGSAKFVIVEISKLQG